MSTIEPKILAPSSSKDFDLTPITESLKFWKKFNLDEQKLQLDKIGIEIPNKKSLSIESRKRLAEETKKFRQQPDETKLKTIGSLMKLYQEEIDRLTNRSQEAEIAFLNIYKSLYDAPDPATALQLSQQVAIQYQTKKIENEKLKKEITDYSSEMSSLQNQDITIRNLQSRLEHLQADFQVQVDNLVAQKLQESNSNSQKIQEEYEQRESQLKLQLQKTLQELDIMRLTNQSNNSFAIDEMVSETKDSQNQVELQLLSDELDRITARNVALEKELKDYKEKYSDNKSNKSSSLEMYTDIIKEKDGEIESLSSDVARIQSLLDSTNAKHTAIVADKDKTINKLQISLNKVQAELSTRPTTAELNKLKAKLQAIQAIEYGVEDDEIKELEDDDLKEVNNALKQKLKKLETELTHVKLSNTDLTKRAENAEAVQLKQDEQINDYKELITKLESDLSGQTTISNVTGDGSALLSSVLQSDIIMDNNGSNSSSMEQIFKEQRDRFRQRMQQLEVDKHTLSAKISAYIREVDELKSDNLKLYERIKILQNSTTANNRSKLIQSDDVMQRYANEYNSQLNTFPVTQNDPFSSRYGSLGSFDRFLLKITRLLFSGVLGRRIVFIYLLFLHLLVFFTTNMAASSS